MARFNLRAIFTVAEMIGPERLLLAHLSALHETLPVKIAWTWGIALPNTFFTFRVKDDRDQTYDLALTDTIYAILELHRPHWNRQQHTTGGHPPLPFDAGLSQPYLLRLTVHHLA